MIGRNAWCAGSRRGLTISPNGSIGAYYPETNPLLPLAYHDLKSKTPAAKSIPVVVRLQQAPDHEAVATQAAD